MQKDNQYCWPFFSDLENGLEYKNKGYSVVITEVWYKDIISQGTVHRAKPYFPRRWQVRMLFSGKSTVMVDDRDICLMKAGDFMIIPEEFGFHAIDESSAIIKCGFDFKMVPNGKEGSLWDELFNILSQVRVYRYSTSARQLFDQILALQNNPGFDYENNLLFLTMALLMNLLNTVVDTLDETRPFVGPRVEKAIRYIQQTVSADTTSAEIAEYMGISAKQLNRLFVQETEKTLGSYISEVRRDKMRSLLQDERLTLQDIANAMNYHDMSSFFRAFKRAEGITPHQYRKKMTGSEE